MMLHGWRLHSGYEQTFVLFFPSSFYGRNLLSFVMAIFHKVRIDIPVTGFQLSDQCTFGHLAIAEKPVWTHLIGKAHDTFNSHFPKRIDRTFLGIQSSCKDSQKECPKHTASFSLSCHAPPSLSGCGLFGSSSDSSSAWLKSNSISTQSPQLFSTTTTRFCASSHWEV